MQSMNLQQQTMGKKIVKYFYMDASHLVGLRNIIHSLQHSQIYFKVGVREIFMTSSELIAFHSLGPWNLHQHVTAVFQGTKTICYYCSTRQQLQ